MDKHHINHEERLPFMTRFGQRPQVVCRSKLEIELGDSSDPVNMVWVTIWLPRAIVVLVDSADPNGGEAHWLDVIEMIHNECPRHPQ